MPSTARIRVGVVTASLTLSIGCSSTPSRRVISVIPRQASESMWVNEHVGVNEAALRNSVGIYWNGPTEEGDVEQQIVLAGRAIKSGNFGMILSPSNPFALNTAVQRSLAAGMSVVIVGNPVSLKPEKHLSFVLNDFEESGTLAAHRMRDVLNGQGEILIVGVDTLDLGGGDRSSFFEEVLSREAPGIKVVERLKGPLSFGQAELVTEKAILAHPHLSAILALNTTATRGAVTAVRTTQSMNRILILGCDHNLDLLFLLRQGVIDSLIVQNMRAMGAIAVENILAETSGKPVAPFAYVKPVLITRQNIDDEAIQEILKMNWRSGR